MNEHLFLVIDGNEFGIDCLTRAYTTLDVTDAWLEFNKHASDEDLTATALYEYDPETQKFELLETADKF